MTSDDGDFYHRTGFLNETCGIYLFTEPDENIELHINFMDISCEKEGRIIVSSFNWLKKLFNFLVNLDQI